MLLSLGENARKFATMTALKEIGHLSPFLKNKPFHFSLIGP